MLPGVEWFIGISVDEDVALSQLQTMSLGAIIVTLIGTALSLLVLILVTQRILKPLHQLRNSMHEINSGDADLTNG